MWGDAATEYAHYCQHVTGLIRQHVKRPAATLLDIGGGGGKNVLNLSRDFDVTGLDLSPAMLAQAKELNPGCTFSQGDITTILYLIRAHGRLRIETDHWTLGIFSLDTWRHVLRETGLQVHEGRYNPGEDRYTVFTCVKKGQDAMRLVFGEFG